MDEEELKATLKEVGVNNLNHSLALDILDRRNDTTHQWMEMWFCYM